MTVKVVIPDDISGSYASCEDIERLRAVAEVEMFPTHPGSEAELTRRIRDANVILSFRPAFTKFPASAIAACPALRMICISGTGVEDVDVAAATARGIAVANVPGPSNRAVAELCFALMLDVARSVALQDRRIRRGEWQAVQGLELGGKTLGIVGLSGIARELAPLAASFGMRVLSWSRNNDPARAAAAGATAVSLAELFAQADVLSLHLRLHPQTRGFIGEPEFARLKTGAILINTARGEIVDETALIAALESGKLRGAGLDVFAQEPLPRDHRLLTLDNVVMTPVAGWNTIDAARRMLRQSIDNVACFLAGNPINIVNQPAKGTQSKESQ